MRRIVLSLLKILVSAGLLYLALRKVDFHELASRFNVASLGWIGLAIAATFLQIFVGVLRWREVSAECGAPLALTQATRYNLMPKWAVRPVRARRRRLTHDCRFAMTSR